MNTATFTVVEKASCIDVITAFSTLAAVLIALFVALRETWLAGKKNKYGQANLIAVWTVEMFKLGNDLLYKVAITNQSAQPIYDVVMSIGVAHGAGPSFFKGNNNNTCITSVPPGTFSTLVPFSGGGMFKSFGVSISFRDINNKYWRRDATGVLVDTPEEPLTEQDIERPNMWGDLEPYNFN